MTLGHTIYELSSLSKALELEELRSSRLAAIPVQSTATFKRVERSETVETIERYYPLLQA